ncbi:DUF1810 domain-containing protein [Lepagella muris]|jgi:uncharacterized protein (DUF1810 family)|uniref:DUF1810 domain-containing protein n=1 Tax=Lepagella muris TaxID=3032870 RepID=A0AC61RKQ8_9BACT|nr:DUF1810 domain-containing protein [Lepagella muris]ROT08090.1 DUF1810 domain-containing protein [Muribaculaceae bacterium Isolate-037 (Harlan)]TGY78763.1 DUF1810 domain-containing protein [Lepagella muris]THG52218.1 DUF1810 domain-containing protein [Bacteroidales bacterium]TKC55207.1 DUF1810 domain-containing protein [Bacteroidales bacterium]
MENLDRFVMAQERTYDVALQEIRNGGKRSHWIWYVFPQLRGLGRTANANYYGIEGKEEAVAYLGHEILGKRLREISNELLNSQEDIRVLMGSGIDVLKLKSSMTLFDFVSPGDVFGLVLDKFFDGKRCRRTLEILST